ncbi:MAG: HAMP domain-containing histidine kinase [Proteobacteria bacterium]|nr:HAMP domain-containing histidine kinase [Pseudomonadota bacterium]
METNRTSSPTLSPPEQTPLETGKPEPRPDDEQDNKPVQTNSILFRFACLTAIAPLLLALVVIGVTLNRLKAEGRRASEIKARVGSIWLADRLADIGEKERSSFLDQANVKLNALVGLFREDGTPVDPGDLAPFSKDDIRQIIAKAETETSLDGLNLAVAATQVDSQKNSLYLVVAAKNIVAKGAMQYAALRLGIASIAVVLAAALFGLVFSRDVAFYLAHFRKRIQEMIDGEIRPSAALDDTAGVENQDSLEYAVSQLQERFRSELIMYRDAAEEIKVLDNERTTFLATISRELRAPLLKIVEQADQLLAGKIGALQESQAEDVRIINQASQRLLGLVNDILDLSTFISKGIEYDDTPVDLAEVALEVVETARGEIGKKDLRIVFKTEDAAKSFVRGSRKHLWQVITNLVSNGIKFTERGEVIVQIGQAEDGRSRIEVSDTGVGIPSSDQQAIFDPFSQRGELSKRLRGAGLGLAICKHLVELHGGEIFVSSKEGEGSCFTVVLPNER